MRAPHGSSKRLGYVVIVLVVLLASGFAAARALTSSIGGQRPLELDDDHHDRGPGDGSGDHRPAGVARRATWPFASDSPWNVPLGSGATFGVREVAAGR